MGPEFKTKKKNASVMGNVLPPNNRVVHKSQVQKLDVTSFIHDSLSLSFTPPPRGRGYSHTLPIRVCAAQRGRDFEAPELERGIRFRGVL